MEHQERELFRADTPRGLGENSHSRQKDGGVDDAGDKKIRAAEWGITRSSSATIRTDKQDIKKLLITTLN